MRILISNPDTMGDLVLRQPFYDALLRGGHELMLVVRPGLTELVPYVAPGTRVLTLPMEVYRDDLPAHWDAFAGLFATARAFEPEALVVAPYQWTLFEEQLADELPRSVRRIGMSGRLYRGDPHAGRSPESRMRFDEVATVDENRAEVEKNAALAAVVLGAPPTGALPTLRADTESVRTAEQTLARLGLEPGGFWIAAVAGTRHVSLKQWRPQAWGEVLAHWAGTFGRQFLFTGLAEERPILEAVRSAMGERASHASIAPDGNGPAGLSQLLALTSLAGGYAGHDTGPMHIAAAMGKPALAVFGGGTWPRFIPAVEPSCSLMVGVPCAGCGWMCAFQRPHCIDAVPVGRVKDAVEDLETGRIQGRDVRVIPADPALKDRMIRESAEIVRQQQRATAEANRHVQVAQAVAAERERHAGEVAAIRASVESRITELEARHAEQIAKVEAAFTESLAIKRTDHAKAVEQLAARVASLEGRFRPAREPWKVRAAKWIAGKNHYVPLLGYRRLPRITIVTPVKNGGEWIGQTIESVLGQGYPHLEYIVVDGASTDDTPKILDEYRDRIDLILREPDEGMYDAIAKGFDKATGDVFGYLNADDVLEPGGLRRVGEYFRDHRFAMVVCHEDTVTMDGWRFPNIAQPEVDLYKLLNGHTLFQDGVFFRKMAYVRVRGMNRQMKRAGDWELFLRMRRMWRFRRAPGHVSSFRVRKGQISEDRAAYDAERDACRAQYEAKLGLPTKLRWRAVQAFNVVRNAVERMLVRRKFFWPIDYCGKAYPPGEAPPLVPGRPVSPLTGRAPDRLLFSTRDTRFGDPRIHYVYYESSTEMAMAYPPLTQAQLTELYERHYSQPLKEVIPPAPGHHSPFRNYKGGNIVARNLSRVPTPWWWFNTITYGDDSASEVLRAVRGAYAPNDPSVRFLDVGCFEGGLLETLKSQTKWKLYGLEANASAVGVARSKGHHVWQATAEDAAVVVPEGAAFDVICLGQTIEHLDDPLIALNRLKLLLAPGGVIVVSVPNLDSKQVELFGPTWAHWHMPYHRTLLSRKALRRMARLAGMRVERLRTRTHPYWSTMTVQLNRLGLGAVVPHTALFPNMIAMHGTRMAGWARLLWDWRGRGDYMIAVLRNN
jgi:glycosyltransferase involved in cell wall biosynthesis/ADP-heptose:LPS heptosyltransferase/2-polyprenyl-3-methyl-5-hydroxy-6-metoxy-1,4-benzoquinol methylase